MKRKFVIVLLSLVCAFCLAFGISACGNGGGTTEGGENGGGQSGNEQTEGGATDGNEDGGNASGGTTEGDENGGEQSDNEQTEGGATGGETTHTHTAGEAVNENEIAATCTENGSYDSVVYCSSCQAEISRETVIVNALGHMYSGSWTCTACGNALTESTGLEYSVSADGSSCEVKGIGTCADTEIVIPYMYENRPVTAVSASAFFRETSVTSVYIPDSVTEIGDSAFFLCESLATVYLGSGVTSVGVQAFYNCTALKSLSLPDSVLTIGDYAFYACVSLKSLDLGGGVTTIGYDAFNGCASLESIVIPASVTQLGNANSTRYNGCVFSQNFSLKSIEVEAGNTSYKSIDGNLYTYDGTKLISYALGKTDHTFTVPEGVTEIGTSAFCYAASLQYVELPSSLKTIGNYAFAYSGLVSVNIPKGVTSLGDYAFCYCYSLVSLTIPSTVTGSAEGSASVYSLVDGCTNLVEVCNLASSVNFVSDDIDIQENWSYYVATYGGYFQIYSKNVYTSADAESVLITQGDYVFYKDGDNYYLAAYTGWDSEIVLPELTVDGKTVNYGISDYALSAGYYYYAKSVFLDNYISESKLINGNMLNVKSIVIPDCVTSIGNYALAYNYLLEGITLESGSTSFGNYAFAYCAALNKIAIPDTVTTIGYYAFAGITAEIAWGDNPSITEISDAAFAGYLGTSITIPSSVTSIGIRAFYGCENITSITVTESVTYIGISAFVDCTSLKNVIFENTSGWQVTVSETDTDGTEVDVTDSGRNATYMTGNYRQYYWNRIGN